jgi:hypothetical protein
MGPERIYQYGHGVSSRKGCGCWEIAVAALFFQKYWRQKLNVRYRNAIEDGIMVCCLSSGNSLKRTDQPWNDGRIPRANCGVKMAISNLHAGMVFIR